MSDPRKVRHTGRFERLSKFYVGVLRRCRWRGSLVKAFEEPSLHLAGLSDQGCRIPRSQFLMAMNYAVVFDPTICSRGTWDAGLCDIFDSFDVVGDGYVDCREVTLALQQFTQPLDTEPESVALMWWRAYRGDVLAGGINVDSLVDMLCALCISADEARGILDIVRPALDRLQSCSTTLRTAAAETAAACAMDVTGAAASRRGSQLWRAIASTGGAVDTGGIARSAALAARRATAAASAARRLAAISATDHVSSAQVDACNPLSDSMQLKASAHATASSGSLIDILVAADSSSDSDTKAAATHAATRKLSTALLQSGPPGLEPSTGIFATCDVVPEPRLESTDWIITENTTRDVTLGELTTTTLPSQLKDADQIISTNIAADESGQASRTSNIVTLRIDATAIHLLFRLAPALAGELQRLRLLRTHPLLRSQYEASQAKLAIIRVKAALEGMRATAGEVRAAAWQRTHLRHLAFRTWSAWTNQRRFIASLVISFQARCACRRWWTLMHAREAERGRRRLALLHRTVFLLRSSMAAWREHVAHASEVRATGIRRADGLRQYHTKRSVLQHLHANALHRRADRFNRFRISRDYFRLWVAAATAARDEQRAITDARTKSALEAGTLSTSGPAQLRAALAALDAELRAQEAEVAAAQHAAEEAEFYAAAEAAAEAVASAAAHEAAAKRLRDNRARDAMDAARRDASAQRVAAHAAAFNKEWDARMAVGISSARAAGTTWATTTREGRNAVKELAEVLVNATTAAAASQECSEFAAEFSVRDGSIHFKKAAVPPSENTARSASARMLLRVASGVLGTSRRAGIPAVDIRQEQMSTHEAQIVATAHIAGRRAAEVKRVLEVDRAEAWTAAVHDRAARIAQHAWAAYRARGSFLAHFRVGIEVLTDVDTGVQSFLDTRRGVVSLMPPRILRGAPVWDKSSIEWALRRHPTAAAHNVSDGAADSTSVSVCHGDGSTTGNRDGVSCNVETSTTIPIPSTSAPVGGRGRSNSGGSVNGTAQWYYANIRQPWITRPVTDPPPSLILCGICRIAPATRKCLGAGCDGSPLCWACFASSHARGLRVDAAPLQNVSVGGASQRALSDVSEVESRNGRSPHQDSGLNIKTPRMSPRDNCSGQAEDGLHRHASNKKLERLSQRSLMGVGGGSADCWLGYRHATQFTRL